jgi:putative tricarboxylic transport membrane protein
VLGVVLGFMVESNYRRSLQLSNDSHLIFVQDPVSLGLLVVAAALLVYSLRKSR